MVPGSSSRRLTTHPHRTARRLAAALRAKHPHLVRTPRTFRAVDLRDPGAAYDASATSRG